MRNIFYFMKSRQTSAIFKIHMVIILCVLIQIFLSYIIDISEPNKATGNPLKLYGSLLHFFVGSITFFFSLLLLLVAIRTRGFRYYYAIFLGQTQPLIKDAKILISKKLPKPNAGSLAATIQGLGMLALIAVSLSGLCWFLMWFFEMPIAHNIEEVHEIFTKIIQVYIVGHASVGIVHVMKKLAVNNE